MMPRRAILPFLTIALLATPGTAAPRKPGHAAPFPILPPDYDDEFGEAVSLAFITGQTRAGAEYCHAMTAVNRLDIRAAEAIAAARYRQLNVAAEKAKEAEQDGYDGYREATRWPKKPSCKGFSTANLDNWAARLGADYIVQETAASKPTPHP